MGYWWSGPPTKHRARGGSKGLTLQAPPLQEVGVGGAGVAGQAAGLVKGAQVEENGALVVAHEIGFTCSRESMGQMSECVCLSVHVCTCVCAPAVTCKDGFGASWLVNTAVGVEVNVSVSSSQAKRCTSDSILAAATSSFEMFALLKWQK